MACFPRIYRLVTDRDYQSVFAQSTRHKYKNLLALARTNNVNCARLGMVISKRHVKRAVDRNLMRRIIRESFRSHQETLKGLDIIILFRSECSPLDKQILRENIDHLWRILANSLKPV